MVRGLLAQPMMERGSMWWYPGAVASYLDALAALLDRERVEQDTPRFLEYPSALQPFALRALGTVRSDPSLVEQAAGLFDQLGFERQAASTRQLL